MSYRFVVCIDVDAEGMTEAYGKLHEGLSVVNFEGYEGWESTDENFDEDGELVPPETMQQHRDEFFRNKESKT